MNWLVLLFAFEVGMVPNNGWVMQEFDYHLQEQNQYYTEFEFEAEAWDTLFVGGKIKTRMYDSPDSWTYKPFTDEYTFNAGLRFDFLEIGFRHLCTHPVIPYIRSSGAKINYEGAYDELYFRIEVKR